MTQLEQLYEAKSLKDFMSKLTSEEVCQKYMEELRWGNDVTCPHCGAHKPYRILKGKKFRCSNKECRKDFSVTVGSVFEDSKLPFSVWLAAGWLLSAHKKGISSCQLARDLGIGQKAAWFVLHRLRHVMGVNGDDDPLENIVEIDETYVGGKIPNMNRKRRNKIKEAGTDNKTAVMGMVERGGRAKLTVIGKDTFKEVVRKNVDKKATISTDTHLGYWGLDKEFAAHGMVNHTLQEYRNGIYYTNTVEGFFSLFKRTIFGTYHQISPKHLQRYCAESTYRFNSRKSKDKNRFVNLMSNTKGRLKYNELIEKNQTT